MQAIIGYSMRSGSTLLQHMLNEHSLLRGVSDVAALPRLAAIAAGVRFHNLCVKPPDLLYLGRRIRLLGRFDKRVWLTRDPRDSYLSSVESGYAYWFWRRGQTEHGIDTGLLRRWQRIHRHYLDHRHRWHLVRYEDLTASPDDTLRDLFAYLEVPHEDVKHFKPFNPLSGGDYKLKRFKRIHRRSANRHREQLTAAQRAVFADHLGDEMQALGYPLE